MTRFILLLVVKCLLFTDNLLVLLATGTDRPTDNEAVLQNVLSELQEIREKNLQMEYRLAGLQDMEFRLEGAEKRIKVLHIVNNIIFLSVFCK